MSKQRNTEPVAPAPPIGELHEQHLAAAGVDNESRRAAEGLGITPGSVLALIVKYGPTFLAVLKDLLAQKEGRPIRPA